MGHHYIPQFYLGSFTEEEEPEIIWIFERGCSKIFSTHIKNIANENNFYSLAMEQILANEIEDPANKVIKKIINRELITQEEKVILANYLIVMWKRVPSGKEKVIELLPNIMNNVFEKIDKQLISLSECNHALSSRYNRARQQLSEIKEDPKKREEIFRIAWLMNIPAGKTPQSVDALSKMTWCFLVSDDLSFITGDNPFSISKEMGIGNEKSDVSFPISNNIALYATWNNKLIDGSFHKANCHHVREINRRTVKNSLKYVYSSSQFDWIPKLLAKSYIKIRPIAIK